MTASLRRSLPVIASVSAAALIIAMPNSANAQAQTAETPVAQPLRSSYQTWTSITASGPIFDKILFFMDVHGRFYDDFHPYQVLIRPAIGYKLPLGFSAFVGYAYTPSWNDKREYAEEHRMWEQLSYEAPFKSIKLTARARFEQRFRPESETAHRLRTMVRANIPLGLPIPLQTVVWDEAFFGLNQSVKWQPEAFDQNRLFLGLGYVFNPHFRLDVGYLSHVIPRADAITLHHSLAINAAATW
ncbi:MAG: DUF2490 domain-containing protein [Polyangiaceae bacterium]|nr:DUF2490 domain-containing protein [Polyangiaceae bacterium]